MAVLICAEDIRGEEIGDVVGDVEAGDTGGDHLDLAAWNDGGAVTGSLGLLLPMVDRTASELFRVCVALYRLLEDENVCCGAGVDLPLSYAIVEHERILSSEAVVAGNIFVGSLWTLGR